MKHDVVAPSVGESITEVSILKWLKGNGEAVKNGDPVIEIESDKASVEVAAEVDGVLTIMKQEGETVPIGVVLGVIDDEAKAATASPAARTASPPPAAPPPPPDDLLGEENEADTQPITQPTIPIAAKGPVMSPAAQRIVKEAGLNPEVIQGTGKGGRIMKGDVLDLKIAPTPSVPAPSVPAPITAIIAKVGERRVPMTRIRKKIAERLVEAQRTAAILTTFNELDMGPIMDVRKKYKDKYKEKYKLPFSFMAFFILACIEGLKEIPAINASIDGDDIIYHDYHDIGVAVGTDRGLVVPVIRKASLDFIFLKKSRYTLRELSDNRVLSVHHFSEMREAVR